MFSFPIQYNEPLYRPPSEGKSLIIQITLGCSWNKCSFCEMYTSKHFTVRKEEDVFNDIDSFVPYANEITKVFLADGAHVPPGNIPPPQRSSRSARGCAATASSTFIPLALSRLSSSYAVLNMSRYA